MEEQKVFCKRCGKRLKDPQARELGFGSICYKKHLASLLTNRKALFPVNKRSQVAEVTSYETDK